ncbi:PIG-L family deacetylase [Specibacter sp. NPDC057265]|uniref:PIG-L family deacetylase n=1 Tax=Specibacter sp. NPDC057265 TaxID=3346075 RepID=UPI0036409A44
MVIFSHEQDSVSESRWLDSAGMAGMSGLRLDWTTIAKLVVVAAHPDDETLGAGGLIHQARHHGVPTEIIVGTWGEHSHPRSPTHGPAQLARLRAAELERALQSLAPGARTRALSLPDGALAAHAHTLEQEIVASAAATGRTLIVAPWSADGHSDHDAAGAAAANAARFSNSLFLEYPIWMWHWADPDDPALRDLIPWPALRRLELQGKDIQAKAAAMSSHHSQVAPLSPAPGDEALLSEAMLAHFARPFETFIDVAGQFAPTGNEAVEWTRRQFDSVHADGAEPWSPQRWYEHRKRGLLLAGLDRPLFDSGLEIGCSTGALLEELAPRCRQLLGTDASAQAIKSAQRRTAQLDNVRCLVGTLPDDWPEGSFDLLVLSESGYYFTASALAQLLDRMAGSAAPNAVLAACHWRHPIAGWPLDGAFVHSRLRLDPRWTLEASHLEEDFQLDFFKLAELP